MTSEKIGDALDAILTDMQMLQFDIWTSSRTSTISSIDSQFAGHGRISR